MNRHGTWKIFAIIVVAYGLALLPGLFVAGYLDSPMGVLVAVPYLSIYLFHAIGMPGLLEHGGLCGWGWCAPTTFGLAFLAVVWLGLAWLAARLVASVVWREGRGE